MTAPTSAAERAAYISEVTLAASKGAVVQCRYRDRDADDDWDDALEPAWDWACFDYRVKPEEAVPRTVTFIRDSLGTRIIEWPEMKNPGQATFTELPPGWEVRRIETP